MAKRKITQLDLFSGIGGFHLGFKRAGYEVESYFSEIDKHAVAVYKHRFKNSTYVGSVTDVRGAELPSITFGSPCQDFSLAGKRKGLSGDRSGLITEAIRLIGECRPSVFIWENVKGSFSSNDGEDFAAILQEFTNIGGYRLEWQLLNTSWVLPQNRERVYFVGYSTIPRGRWSGVFPIREKFRGFDERAVYATNVRALVAGANSGGLHSSMTLLKIKSATSKGYEEAQEGDSINLTAINSTTRRGRVGKKTAQTLDTLCAQAVVKEDRIRRLTPIECERLQGFPDNHTEYGNYDGEVKKMSNTQRYKQCGNAVTVDIVALVAEAVKPLLNRTV
jgi:DNA (cytosine-5)-methyltransferase 1